MFYGQNAWFKLKVNQTKPIPNHSTQTVSTLCEVQKDRTILMRRLLRYLTFRMGFLSFSFDSCRWLLGSCSFFFIIVYLFPLSMRCYSKHEQTDRNYRQRVAKEYAITIKYTRERKIFSKANSYMHDHRKYKQCSYLICTYPIDSCRSRSFIKLRKARTLYDPTQRTHHDQIEKI